MEAPPEADEDLYRRVRQGDLAAFDRLYARYERRLFGFILRMVRSRADAEDLFHESFLCVLAGREVGFSATRGSFCAWMYRIARNKCLNHLRGRRHGRAVALEPGVDATAGPGSAEDGLWERERAGAVAQAVERLPPALSELFHLRSSGLSYEDMAQVLEVPLGTVKSRMNQLVRTLKEEVSEWNAPSYKMS